MIALLYPQNPTMRGRPLLVLKNSKLSHTHLNPHKNHLNLDLATTR